MTYQQPSGPAYPADAERSSSGHVRSKKKNWPWILLALILALILLFGGFFLFRKHSDHTIPSSGLTSSEKTAVAGVGSAVREQKDGKFEFVVADVKPGAKVLDEPARPEKATSGQFVVVTLHVKNISSEPASFFPDHQKLFDEQGRSYVPDTAVHVDPVDSGQPVGDNIKPGETQTAKVVFEIPADAKAKVIELHDSNASPGVQVSLG